MPEFPFTIFDRVLRLTSRASAALVTDKVEFRGRLDWWALCPVSYPAFGLIDTPRRDCRHQAD
jgi:hypothetical protein